jgi:hypothetical protein
MFCVGRRGTSWFTLGSMMWELLLVTLVNKESLATSIYCLILYLLDEAQDITWWLATYNVPTYKLFSLIRVEWWYWIFFSTFMCQLDSYLYMGSIKKLLYQPDVGFKGPRLILAGMWHTVHISVVCVSVNSLYIWYVNSV